jgi:hypothetical protein
VGAVKNWDSSAERAFWRQKCKEDFWWFFKYAYGYDFNPKGGRGTSPWLDEATHKPFCNWFQKHALEWLDDRKHGRRRAKKLIAIVPRDWGKTTLGAQAGQMWLHLHDPELATYTGADTLKRAREILQGIKAVLSGEDIYSRFAWLYGNQKATQRKWKVDGVVTAERTNLTRRDDSYGLWGVETSLVGLHPDGCFFDDPNTYERLERHADWLDVVNRHLDTLIPVFQADALWMLTNTRYGDGDHIGKSLKYEGIASVEGMPMPGYNTTPGGLWHVFFLDAEDSAGNPTMPRIWPKERIESFKSRNMVRYYAQVRNNPTQSPYNILTKEIVSRFIVQPLDDKELKGMRVSIHLDTAFKSPKRKARGDRNVIGSVGHQKKTGKCVFLGAAISTKWQSEEFRDALVETVKFWRAKGAKVVCITDEEEIGGKPGLWPAFLKTAFRLKNVEMPELMIFRRPGERKEERLNEAASLWREGRMLLPTNSPGLDDLIEEMTKIGMSEYDDVADAIADCFHKKVYSIIWQEKAESLAREQRNPFDEVLKPGAIGDAAAEEIAAMYEKRNVNLEGVYFDVVQV